MPAGRLTSVGIGDDAAVVGAPSGSVVAAVDLVLEGRHFRRDWSSAHDVGVKAAARSLADIAAMGAVNTALLVALAAPGELPARWATDLAAGLAAEATRAGAGIAGGDTASAESVVLSVTALGDLEGRAPVLRSGARPGDVIAVAGDLGRSAAGLALLAARGPSPAGGFPGELADLVTAHRRPAPPYDAGPEAARLGATAMIDVSDGLLADLGHIAAASGRAGRHRQRGPRPPGRAARGRGVAGPPGGRGRSSRRPAPEGTGAADPVTAMALGWVLTGGEDHALVAAFPPGTALPGPLAGDRAGPRRRGRHRGRRRPPRTCRLAALPLSDRPRPYPGARVRAGRARAQVEPARRVRRAGSQVCVPRLAGHLAGLDAGSAHVESLGGPGHDRANGLNIRVPATAGAYMRMRHVVAEARPLAANVADGSHGCLQ